MCECLERSRNGNLLSTNLPSRIQALALEAIATTMETVPGEAGIVLSPTSPWLTPKGMVLSVVVFVSFEPLEMLGSEQFCQCF